MHMYISLGASSCLIPNPGERMRLRSESDELKKQWMLEFFFLLLLFVFFVFFFK